MSIEKSLFKKGVKYFTYFVLLVLVINIPFNLYLLGFRLVVFNENLHKSEFEKYGIYEKFPDADIDQINSNLLDYFKHEEKNIQIESDFFNEKEKTHLIDVKLIMRMSLFSFYSGFVVLIFKLLLLFILVGYQKEDIINYLSFMMAVGGILTIVPVLLLLAAIKINFDMVFRLFHLNLFSNDLWILNPATDNLIVMYPSGFFYDLALKLVWAVLIQAIALILIGISVYKIRKRFKNKQLISL